MIPGPRHVRQSGAMAATVNRIDRHRSSPRILTGFSSAEMSTPQQGTSRTSCQAIGTSPGAGENPVRSRCRAHAGEIVSPAVGVRFLAWILPGHPAAARDDRRRRRADADRRARNSRGLARPDAPPRYPYYLPDYRPATPALSASTTSRSRRRELRSENGHTTGPANGRGCYEPVSSLRLSSSSFGNKRGAFSR
jgi:hypothetical protein